MLVTFCFFVTGAGYMCVYTSDLCVFLCLLYFSTFIFECMSMCLITSHSLHCQHSDSGSHIHCLNLSLPPPHFYHSFYPSFSLFSDSLQSIRLNLLKCNQIIQLLSSKLFNSWLPFPIRERTCRASMLYKVKYFLPTSLS